MSSVIASRALPIGFALLLGGCGLHVPDVQENPFATEEERSLFIQAIVRNVRCEVQDAVVRLYADNPSSIDPYNRNLGWFDSWAAQISLTLTTDEKSTLNPVFSWLPTGSPSTPSSIFTLGASGTLSADAQRVDKIGSFFTIAELKKLHVCPSEVRNRGPFILASDLKLYDWLKATMIAIDNGDTPGPENAGGPNKSNVLSHEVKFDIVSTGGVTPGWKLTQTSFNQSGTFFSATRDRTQDLTMTFGPPDPAWIVLVTDPVTHKVKVDPKTKKPIMQATALAPAAASAAAAADIGVAVSNGVRNGLRF
jgi:hypothetical protein